MLIYMVCYTITQNLQVYFSIGFWHYPTTEIMATKDIRTEEAKVWDKKIGATIAFIRQRDWQQSQSEFAESMGVSRSLLANIESGRTSLKARIGWDFCKKFCCHPGWLCTGGNSHFPNVFPDLDGRPLEIINKTLEKDEDTPFRVFWPFVAWLALGEKFDFTYDILNRDSAKNKSEVMLDNVRRLNDDSGVKQIRSLPQLLDELRKLLKVRGAKVALSLEMNVTRQAVDQWLSGKTSPTAEMTFELISWVEKRRGRTK